MFKNFQPKEHIAGNAPMKTSAQRNIRNKLVEQLPFLALPALAPSAPAAPAAPAPAAAPAASDDEDDDAGRRGGKKGGKEGKKGGKGGKGDKGGKKGGRRGDDEPAAPAAEEDAGDEEGLTVLDLIWPKKETLSLVKCRDHISIFTVHGEPIFFQHFDGPFYPTLKVLHRFPGMLPRVGVDRGAIKFVLSGANIMCPGMTSATGYLPPSSENIPKGTPVAVYAYGKEHPLAIGLTSMSTDDIRGINKNIGVENVAFLGDDLWKVEKL
ncbi:translation machinery-associated protein 20 [Rhodotorula kratochvilovae]